MDSHTVGGNPEQLGLTSRLILRVMLGLWLLMAVVLGNVYSSMLTSFLAVPKLETIPNSFEELATNYKHVDECLLTVQQGHPVISRFYVSKMITYSSISIVV